MIGKHLGPYEITAKLGEGGMGEVYRATDSKLRREVAIKVLPEAFAADAERLARFEREAQLLAQLQHPQIASIYGLEESDGQQALVMELIEGPTLDERMATGARPLDEALSIARLVAGALEAAHAKGIVHRDLKPQNVKLTAEGEVKVLDFGLAKAMDPVEVDVTSDLAQSPTLLNSPTLTALPGTQLGVILGTAAYMAPEQARGLAVDKKADIWAFGVLLWEMLTGKRLFEGELVTDVLAGVLRQDVDLEALPAATPPRLRGLVRRCLVRNPKDRLHDIADARIEIEDLLAGKVDSVTAAVAPPAGQRRRELFAWVLAMLAVLALVALLWGRGSTNVQEPRVLRVTMPNPEGVTLELDGERSGMPALSPDGRRVAFGARVGSGPMRIWVRDLDRAEARPLPGTEGGYRPCWSPDGQRLGFFTWSALAITSADGGPVTRLAPGRDSRGCTWSPNGTIVFAPYAYGPLEAISETGGEPYPVTSMATEDSEGTHRFPKFLPDGESFLYLSRSSPFAVRGQDAGVEVARLGSSDPPTRLLDFATNADYADQHLLFVRDGALVAQPFDPDRLALSGHPVVLVEDLLVNRRFSYGVFSAGGQQTLAFLTGEQSDLSRLVWRDRAGRHLGELGAPGNISGYGGMALSGNGRWAAVARIAAGATDSDLWIFDLERGTETQLVQPITDEFDPIYSPDSTSLFYGTTRSERMSIRRRDLEAGDEIEILSADARGAIQGRAPMSFSPDGAWLTVDERHYELQSDIVVMPTKGEAEPRSLFATPADEAFGQISPDGRWLVWSSEESGRYEVYVTSFPEPGSTVQVSRAGGEQPRWNPRGGEIFFKTPDNVLTAIPIELGSGTVSVGTPQPMFAITEFMGWTYAIAPDGERFLVREPIAETAASAIHLLTDWTSLVGDS